MNIKVFLSMVVVCIVLAGVSSAQTQYLPQLAVGGPPTGTNIQALVFLFNNASEPVSGSANIFDDGGSPLPVVINRQGAPTASFRWNLMPGQTARFLFTGRSSALEAGWLKITPQGNRSVGVTLIYQLFESSELMSEAGVLPSPTQTGATVVYDGLGGANTGIALANPGNQAIDVMLNLTDEMGQPLGSRSIRVPANGHTAKFVSEIFQEIPLPMEGTVTMTSTRPFSAVGVRVNGSRLSAVPVLSTTRARPQITSLSTDSGLQGQTISDFVIRGSNLSNATAINFDPATGITATVQSSNNTMVRARLMIDTMAAIGNYNLTVTTRNMGVEQTSNALVFRVVRSDAPMIESLSPSSAEQGSTIDPFTITGTNLSGVTSIDFDPSTGITVSNIQSSSAEVRARLSIDATAQTGTRQVRVTSPTGMSNARSFQIIEATAPMITGISPTFASEGQTIDPFIISGSNLDNVESVQFEPGGGITGTITSQSATEVRARVSFLATAGPRLVFVRTGAGRESNKVFFFLQANPLRPVLNSLSPTSGVQGQTIDTFTINGTHLDNATSINFTPSEGIMANITSKSASQIQARLVIDSSVAVGPYQVTVTNPSGTSAPLTFVVMTGPPELGDYLGTTAQENDISFTVTAQGVSDLMTIVRVSCGSEMRNIEVAVTGPVPINPSNQFTTTLDAGGARVAISGQFNTTNTAQGSINVPSPPMGCSTLFTPFTATRQP